MRGIIMLTQKELKSVIKYYPLTGKFTWTVSRGFIARGSECKGLIHITYKNRRYAKSRLAWLYMTGVYPDQTIYKIDGDNHNFKFENLTMKNNKTINKNHVDIGCIVDDNSYHVFVIEKGTVVDLGIHDDYQFALDVTGKYLCLK